MVLHHSVAATAAAAPPTAHHHLHHHHGHHQAIHHHGRANVNQSGSNHHQASSNQSPVPPTNQPLAAVLNLHHPLTSTHRGSIRGCSLYNGNSPSAPPPAHQSCFQQQGGAHYYTSGNPSQQSRPLTQNPSAMHDHFNVHLNHHQRRNVSHNGTGRDGSSASHGSANGHNHLNSSSSRYNANQRQTSITDEYGDVVRKSGESPSRKRRRTDVYEVDPASVESLSPVELSRFRNLVNAGPGARSPPELVPANSPRHEENVNGSTPVGWRPAGPQVSVLQISPTSDLEMTIQVAEGTTANGSNLSPHGRHSASRRLSQLSPVFVMNSTMNGVTFIGQATPEVMVPESDLIHELSDPHHGHLQHQHLGTPEGSASSWAANPSSGSIRRSVITHAISGAHDRNNNPLNENVSNGGTTSGPYADLTIDSPSEDSKSQRHFPGQSSAASVDSLTDADTQSIENGSQMSDTQSIDSTAATIDSTSEASLAVFRGPVATSASYSTELPSGFPQQIASFVDEPITRPQQILQLQAAAYRERSQSQSSQASSSSRRVGHQQCLSVPPQSNVSVAVQGQTASAVNGTNQPNQANLNSVARSSQPYAYGTYVHHQGAGMPALSQPSTSSSSVTPSMVTNQNLTSNGNSHQSGARVSMRRSSSNNANAGSTAYPTNSGGYSATQVLVPPSRYPEHLTAIFEDIMEQLTVIPQLPHVAMIAQVPPTIQLQPTHYQAPPPYRSNVGNSSGANTTSNGSLAMQQQQSQSTSGRYRGDQSRNSNGAARVNLGHRRLSFPPTSCPYAHLASRHVTQPMQQPSTSSTRPLQYLADGQMYNAPVGQSPAQQQQQQQVPHLPQNCPMQRRTGSSQPEAFGQRYNQSNYNQGQTQQQSANSNYHHSQPPSYANSNLPNLFQPTFVHQPVIPLIVPSNSIPQMQQSGNSGTAPNSNGQQIVVSAAQPYHPIYPHLMMFMASLLNPSATASVQYNTGAPPPTGPQSVHANVNQYHGSMLRSLNGNVTGQPPPSQRTQSNVPFGQSAHFQGQSLLTQQIPHIHNPHIATAYYQNATRNNRSNPEATFYPLYSDLFPGNLPHAPIFADSPEAENYEALLNLAERLGEAKPRGLTKQEIDQLPSYKYKGLNDDADQTICVVCMCDFEIKQSLRILPCSHEFHVRCVDKWLKTNRTCPICRRDSTLTNHESD